MEQAKNLDSQKFRLLEESEERSKLRQVELEREIEDKNREYED